MVCSNSCVLVSVYDIQVSTWNIYIYIYIYCMNLCVCYYTSHLITSILWIWLLFYDYFADTNLMKFD